MRVARKEPEPYKTFNTIVKIAAVFGMVVAVFLIVKYICKKCGIKSAICNPCCCDDDSDCECYDEDECCDDENECEDECCDADSCNCTGEDITDEEKPD
jgi:hypothetical protein